MAAVRSARETDAPAIQAIYAHYVVNSAASFELDPPDVETVRARMRRTAEAGCPYLVLESADSGGGGAPAAAGYAYASPWRTRPAYRWTVECSVYVHPDHQRRGYGRALLSGLIAACGKAGFRQMIAVISGGEASAGLHAAMGFEHAGILRAVGRKHAAWRDTVMMQRALGPGAQTPPED